MLVGLGGWRGRKLRWRSGAALLVLQESASFLRDGPGCLLAVACALEKGLFESVVGGVRSLPWDPFAGRAREAGAFVGLARPVSFGEGVRWEAWNFWGSCSEDRCSLL